MWQIIVNDVRATLLEKFWRTNAEDGVEDSLRPIIFVIVGLGVYSGNKTRIDVQSIWSNGRHNYCELCHGEFYYL